MFIVLNTKKIFILLIAFFIQISYAQDLKDLTILHWNDFHSQNIPQEADKKYYPEMKDSVIYVGGSAYLLGYINKYREIDKNVIVLNAGDDFQGTPVSTLTKGRSQIELMNITHPDAMTLGNHEFDYSADTLFKILKKANFDVISANILNKLTQEPYLKPYKIISINGIKIAIIGVMTPELPSLSFPDNIKNISVGNIFSTVRKYISELKNSNKPDLFIILSHCGIENDEKLADSIPDINVIIGGHSHTILKKYPKRNKTIICQAGDKGKFLGRLNLKVDISGDSIYSYSGELIPTINSQIIPDPEMKKKVEELESFASKGLNEIIGNLKSDWVRSYGGESNIGNWETDVIKKYTKSDIAFQNAGGIRKNLNTGNITIRDIWEINPFGNYLVKFTIRGDSLKLMLEYQSGGASENLQVSGLKYKYNPDKPPGKRIISITIGKEKLNMKKYYTIGTNNYLASQGKKYFGFDLDPASIVTTGLLDRDVFIDAVKKQKRIDSKIENRIVKITK